MRKTGGGLKGGREGGSAPTDERAAHTGRRAGCWAGAPPWETAELEDQSAFEAT